MPTDAKLLDRAIAYFIDIAIVIGASVLIGRFPVLRIPVAVAGVAYLLFRDSIPFLNGQSIGKKAFNLRVVSLESDAAITGNHLASFLRNVVLIVPLMPLIEGVMIFMDGENRRLGDKLAKTKVVLIDDEALKRLR